MRDRSGTDVIRAAARNRGRGGGLQRLASDLHLPLTQLDSFAYQGVRLPSEALRLLVTGLFAGHAEYDAELDLLRATNREPATTISIRPPQCERRPLSEVVPSRVPPKQTAQLPARPRRPGSVAAVIAGQRAHRRSAREAGVPDERGRWRQRRNRRKGEERD
jgi:hypothetical protein